MRMDYRWIIALSIVLGFSLYLYITFRQPLITAMIAAPSKPNFNQAITPIPILEIKQDDKSKLQLGLRLFLDPRLSSNNQVSCASCHNIYTNGAETTKVSTGVLGKGNRNSPTVYNVSFNTRFFWDGRAASLHEQIDGPIHNPLEMNTNWKKITQFVQSDQYYQIAFTEEYDEQISENTIKDALISFMLVLNTPNADFDRYLLGNPQAMSQTAINGWAKFQTLGCIYCHQGKNVGGNIFQKFGHVESLDHNSDDLGRFSLTQEEADKNVFRVPSLRNVAITPPYFHDGRAEILEDAILLMAKMQLGKDLDPVTLLELSAFLNALSAPPPPALKALQ
ncbi:cytochrome-c peroxidase [Shewanella surugensis]|uniref:Cytochrome-c peroxidase n=1 Tax=Shewanella surugensis TaxID=212020 RepID=A0ABT0LFV4_9GAMM|nr:cytochrome c peroxidase [Shewanella surugensis]MCL1126569.1 cytochrome-c peroxidase [Shewanella surugensis]